MKKGFELCMVFGNLLGDKVIHLNKINVHAQGTASKWEGNYPVMAPGKTALLRVHCDTDVDKLTVAGYVVIQGIPQFFMELDYINRLIFTVSGPIYPMISFEVAADGTDLQSGCMLKIMPPPKNVEDKEESTFVPGTES